MKAYYYTETLHQKIKKEYSQSQIEAVHQAMDHYIKEYKTLKADHNPESVAYNFNNEMQKMIDTQLAMSNQKISCKKGCFFCCMTLVDITLDEAHLLIGGAEENNYTIDWHKVKHQAYIGDNTFNWTNKLSLKDKKCVFLKMDGTCGNYQYRPAACRKHMVVSDPIDCDTSKPGKVKRAVIDTVEVIASATLNACESGPMPKMLLKAKGL